MRGREREEEEVVGMNRDSLIEYVEEMKRKRKRKRKEVVIRLSKQEGEL